MQALLVVVVVAFLLGAGMLEAVQTDPANTHNIVTTEANAVAENAFYYMNTAVQYAIDNGLRDRVRISKAQDEDKDDDHNFDAYMLDPNYNPDDSLGKYKAKFVFKLLNDHIAYVDKVNDSSYVLISWNAFSEGNGYHPLGVSHDKNLNQNGNYTQLSDGIMGSLATILTRQTTLGRRFPYVIAKIKDITKDKCDINNVYFYDLGLGSVDKDKYKSAYVSLCNDIKNDNSSIRQYIIFEQI